MDWKTKVDAHFGIEKPVVNLEPVSYTKVADYHAMGVRYCTIEGCGKKLRSDNHTDLCKTHRYVKKNAERKKRQQTSRQDAIKTPPAEPLGVEDRGNGGQTPPLVDLKVSEEFLDVLWSKLSIEQKARCLQGARIDLT